MPHVTCYMKLIVGLGNPGEKYKLNRHNVGFMFVNYLLEIFKIKFESTSMSTQSPTFKTDKYLFSEIARVGASNSQSQQFILAKPQTYMNKSGDAVKKTVLHYKLKPSQSLIIIHDDLDIPFGKFKIQMQGPKLHNGLTSVQNKLRTMDFLRVRIGVDSRPPENRMSGEEFVLQDFTKEESSQLPELFKKIEIQFEPFLQSKNNCS